MIDPILQPKPEESAEVATEDVRDLLLHINREMVGATSLDQILQGMVDAALTIVPAADKCVIHLLDASGLRLQALVCSQPSLVGADSAGMSANMGIAGRALRENRTICIDDTAHAPDFISLRSGPDLRSLLVAPLYVADRALGTLSLSSSHIAAFGAADQQHMRTLASQASVAIHQAKLFFEAVNERERSDAIIASISDGLAIIDGAGRIVRLNRALGKMLEVPGEGLSLPISLHDSSCPEQLHILLGQAVNAAVGPYEAEVMLPSGSKATLLVVPSLLEGRGLATDKVLVVHDVTAERTAAEMRALFISQVSHELRAPLQHILGFTSLLSDIDDLPRETCEHFFVSIQDEVNHLARLVDDLGQLSRIETGRFSVYMERARLDELVADAVAQILPRAQLRGLMLALDNSAKPIWVLTDPLRLKQVLTNLVENAVKFTPQDGRIDVRVEEGPADAIVRVADNGSGIAPEALPFIFERFYQVRSPEQRKHQGMGLGLFISREIMLALGGDIWVESKVGVGSTFSFRLPKLGE